jgi:hypothetical protein
MDEESFLGKYSLGVFDAEVRALHRLIIKSSDKKNTRNVDDRRFSIEVQFSSDKALRKKDLLAVVLPEPYLLEPRIVAYFKSLNAKIISYQIHPFNPNMYYGIIYEKVWEFYKRNKYL